ncbi:MAG: AAA family ATPase [Proteobacteria bacterium]|nr:AAA family ATPase [Pseudomonadota bacterium]
MELTSVQIENFRSIKSEHINFDPNCLILVGINEGGKTNVLHALRLLSPDYKIQDGDKRDSLGDEGWDLDSYIRFVFNLTNEDTKILSEKIATFSLNTTAKTICQVKGVKKSFYDTVAIFFTQGVYRIEIKHKTKAPKFLNYETALSVAKLSAEKVKILPNWKKVKKQCPLEYKVKDKDGKESVLKDFTFINVNDFPDLNEDYLEEFTFKFFYDHLGGELTSLIKDNLPEVIFWEYSEKFLLPPTINIDEFSNKPTSSVPLKNIFELCGIYDISAAIEEAKTRPNGFDHLLTRISKKTTAHIKKIWPGNPIKVEIF